MCTKKLSFKNKVTNALSISQNWIVWRFFVHFTSLNQFKHQESPFPISWVFSLPDFSKGSSELLSTNLRVLLYRVLYLFVFVCTCICYGDAAPGSKVTDGMRRAYGARPLPYYLFTRLEHHNCLLRFWAHGFENGSPQLNNVTFSAGFFLACPNHSFNDHASQERDNEAVKWEKKCWWTHISCKWWWIHLLQCVHNGLIGFYYLLFFIFGVIGVRWPEGVAEDHIQASNDEGLVRASSCVIWPPKKTRFKGQYMPTLLSWMIFWIYRK